MGPLYDVVSLGELLIDFTPYGKSAEGRELLETNPGGGPPNMLSMVSMLGGKTAFVGKVGDDHYGHFLEETVRSRGIDTRGVLFDKSVFTTLAFVHLTDQGDRSFSFARKPGADILLRQDEVDWDILRRARIFHYSTVSMTEEPIRGTVKRAVQTAREAGALVSFDPNYRPFLWGDVAEAKAEMEYGISHCDILKISGEELELATGVSDVAAGVDHLFSRFSNLRIVFATLGRDGCYYRMGDVRDRQPTFTRVKTIDTTGAGDTFLGCCLCRIAEAGSLNPDKKTLDEIVYFASAAASLITTRRGGICSVPGEDEIRSLMAEGY